MDVKKIQKDFLVKFHELTGLQCIKAMDLDKINPKQLDKNRIVSRVLTSGIGTHKYQRNEVTEHHKKHIQININTLTITFSMISSYENALSCHNFFNHLVGSLWWNARGGHNYVIEDVTPIVDVSDTVGATYREKYVFDIITRVQDETVAEIELIKKVNFDLDIKGGIK